MLRKIIVKKQRLIERGIGYVNRKKIRRHLRSKQRAYFACGKRCKKEYEKGNDVVVVLSAMGDVTDQLIDKAKEINETPSEREMDMLFTIGEQMSVALMAMALEGLGVPAVSLNAFQAKSTPLLCMGMQKLPISKQSGFGRSWRRKKLLS